MIDGDSSWVDGSAEVRPSAGGSFAGESASTGFAVAAESVARSVDGADVVAPELAASSGELAGGAVPLAEPSEIEREPKGAIVVFGDRIELARRYLQALAGDGVVRGLIGPREAGRLWSRHVLNSAVAGTLLTAGHRVVDIGSGAGLPGIPLAIARPDCEFVLIEPLERRTVFLQQVVSELGLDNCTVVRGRADQVVEQCGGADVATSRAVAPLDRLAGWSAPLLRTGGELLALKGSSAADEIERDRVAVAAVGLIELTVVSVGAGIVDPETLVIRGRKVAVSGRRKAKPRGRR